MGQYRFSMYFKRGIGLWIEYDPQPRMLNIRIPLLSINIGLTSYAHGYHFPWNQE